MTHRSHESHGSKVRSVTWANLSDPFPSVMRIVYQKISRPRLCCSVINVKET